jgi:hypothetical protein
LKGAMRIIMASNLDLTMIPFHLVPGLLVICASSVFGGQILEGYSVVRDTSKAVIYVRVRTNGPAVRNIADQVNDTVRNLRETGSPNVTVKHVKTLTTQDASKAEIYYFNGDKFGNFEATAYIQGEGSIHFVTLSARDQDSFRQAIPAFDAVVTSYEDLTKPAANEAR